MTQISREKPKQTLNVPWHSASLHGTLSIIISDQFVPHSDQSEYAGVRPYTGETMALVRVSLRKSPDDISRTALKWEPEGEWRRGQSRETRGRTVENGKWTSLDGILEELLLHRPQTGMDGMILWPAQRVVVGPMRISEWVNSSRNMQKLRFVTVRLGITLFLSITVISEVF